MNRRKFTKVAAIMGATATLPRFSFATSKGSDRIKVGLVGCGGRGSSAICNMMDADSNIQIVAIGDLFEDKVESGKQQIEDYVKKFGSDAKNIFDADKVKKFVGWDAIDQVIASGVDVVVDACAPVYRTPHFEKIVAAGKHAFLEKPPCVDAVQARRMLELSKKADEKGLCVICGTQRRYSTGYQDMIARIHDNAIGDIVSAQCYWNSARYVGGPGFINHEELACDTLEYQIRNWFSFIWASGDHIVEQHVHNIDVLMWALGDKRMPVDVRGWGGRSTDLPTPKFGDRFSHFSVDFDMGKGLRLASYCQQDPKASVQVGERIVGTKGIAYSNLHGKISIIDLDGKEKWVGDKGPQAMVEEHKFLFNAIRKGIQVNKLDQLVNSTLLAIAGRMSAYSGKKFKYNWVLAKSKESFLPETQDLNAKMPMNGVPVPGKYELV